MSESQAKKYKNRKKSINICGNKLKHGLRQTTDICFRVRNCSGIADVSSGHITSLAYRNRWTYRRWKTKQLFFPTSVFHSASPIGAFACVTGLFVLLIWMKSTWLVFLCCFHAFIPWCCFYLSVLLHSPSLPFSISGGRGELTMHFTSKCKCVAMVVARDLVWSDVKSPNI